MVKKKKIKLTIFAFSFIVLVFFLCIALVPLNRDKLKPYESYRFHDREGKMISLLISRDGFFRMHVPLSDISPLFIKTLLLQEDRHFYKHIGVNPLSIFRATIDNFAAGEIVSGGSTITMQLSRMMERRKRTLWAKIIESFCALKLEFYYSKDEILAFYLALAPYGGNIEGIQSASWKYFGKPSSALSVGETALLVSIPKDPNKYRPDRYPEKAKAARNRVLKNMYSFGIITEDQLNRSLREEIILKSGPDINLIPHTAWHFRLKNPDKYVWKTTIDENIQRRVNRLLKNYIQTLEAYNITNASAVVIDNKTREIRAIVGSVDYFSIKHLGANDGSRAPRSPGSTLKPFLYGLAFQEGLISEKTILYDIPINYAGYSPQNYSKEFLGPVHAREALIESLNVVAVRLSKQLGNDKLFTLLKNGGITSLNKPLTYYGLPLVLGGVEIKLVELTNLYASLANNGMFEPYKILQDDYKNINLHQDSKRLLSEEATWLVTHILTDVERPDFPESWQFSKNRPTIAWKTGTSYGHQDAWGIGFTPEYTIGVWVGNFDGTTSRGLAGSKTAGPILFDLFQAIKKSSSFQWFAQPPMVKSRKVCSISGKLPTRYCPSLISEYYIENANNNLELETCDIHHAISVDITTGQQATAETKKENLREQIFQIWPPEMATFMIRHGVPINNVPVYDPGNMAGQKYYPPVILSPVKNTVYYQRLDKLDISDHGIKLSAAATNRVRNVFWFLDDTFIADTNPQNDIFINPRPGKYLVTLMDDVGGIARVNLVVKDYRDLNKNE